MEGINIEAGVGHSPFSEFLRPELKGDGSKYLVDIDRKTLKHAKDPSSSREMAVLSDAANLPFKEGQAGSVFCKDFLGDPHVVPEGEENEVISKIAKEWFRVLAPGGFSVILETSTPQDIETVISVFKKVGFDAIERNDQEDSGRVFVSGDNGKLVRFAKGAYSLVFQKPKI